MFTTFLGAFLGAFLSLLVSIYIEYQRKPKLSLTVEEPPADLVYENKPAKNARFVRVILRNSSMPRPLIWLKREAAINCNGEIKFHHFIDGVAIFSRSMPIRWSYSDEPISLQILPDGKVAQYFDITKYNAAFYRNCYPGGIELIDVAARFDEEEDCFGWSNESYLAHKGWRNNDWKLSKGRYLVSITVYSAGEKTKGVFLLENSAGRKDFRLLPASEDDIQKVVK